MLGGVPALGRYLEDEDEREHRETSSSSKDGFQWAVKARSADNRPGEAVGRNRPAALQRVAKRDYSRYSASKNPFGTRSSEPVSTD
jgi:hypothetical protein